MMMKKEVKQNVLFGVVLFLLIVVPVDLMLMSMVGSEFVYNRAINRDEYDKGMKGTQTTVVRSVDWSYVIQVFVIEMVFFVFLMFFCYFNDGEGKKQKKLKT